MERYIIVSDNTEIALDIAIRAMFANNYRALFKRIVIITSNSMIGICSEQLNKKGYIDKEGMLRLPETNMSINIESVEKYNYSNNDVRICYGLNSKQLFDIDEKGDSVIEIAITNNYTNINMWANIWDATIVKIEKQRITNLPSVAVQEAMRKIDNVIYDGDIKYFDTTGENFTKAVLKKLKKTAPHSFNPEELCAYAIRNLNWPIHVALELKDFAEKTK